MPADEPQGLICPQCGDDFVPGITECSDCHVALVEAALGIDPLSEADAVETASTIEGAVARGWRDALTYDGVPHRVQVTREPGSPPTYTLYVCEEERAWVEALAAVLEEQPSLEASDAIDRAEARLAEAEPAEAEEPDFDVPDLVAPPEVRKQIDRAETVTMAGMALSILFVGCGLVSGSLWWGVAALIAAAESVRSNRVARARRAAWDQQSEPR